MAEVTNNHEMFRFLSVASLVSEAFNRNNQHVCPSRFPILGAGGSPGACMNLAMSDCRTDRRSQEKSDGDERGVIL